MKILRKTWYFGKHSVKQVEISVYGFNSSPAIYVEVDPGERDYVFHIALGIGIWITLARIFPNSWYPKDYDTRQVGLQFHHGDFWWNFWMPTDSWNSDDPRWRRGSTSFETWIKGKHIVDTFRDIANVETFHLPFYEGVYKVVVTRIAYVHRWSRWPWKKKYMKWEVEAPVPIPHEGKGENSWDQGEDGTYSSSFSGNKAKTPFDAALYFWKSNMEVRQRYGGNDWMPKRFRDNKFVVITKEAAA